MSLLSAYVAVVFGVVVLGIIAISLPLTATRPCHRCEHRVPITARRCRNCGYQYSVGENDSR